MANDQGGSRTFLAIVLGGIVLALIIAAYFMYGQKSATEAPAAPPAAEAPAPAPSGEMAPAPSGDAAPAPSGEMAPAPATPPAEQPN
jgi:hypothetical protein